MEQTLDRQCRRVLQYMVDFGTITQVEAMQELGVMRLAARIHDLRASGYAIQGEVVKTRNRYGDPTSYMKYRLIA